MERQFELLIIIMVLLITALAVLVVFTDRFHNFDDSTEDGNKEATDKIDLHWCKTRHGGMFYVVDNITTCESDCSPNIESTGCGIIATNKCCCKCV